MYKRILGVCVVAVLSAFCGQVLAQSCGPSVNDRGDIWIKSLNVSAPDANGFVTLTYAIGTAVASDEALPQTLVAVKRNGQSLVMFSLPAQNSEEGDGPCPVAEGWGTQCVAAGCTENQKCGNGGSCDCKPSVSGYYEKCKCLGERSGAISVPASSLDIMTLQADSGDAHAEDDECNNTVTAAVP